MNTALNNVQTYAIPVTEDIRQILLTPSALRLKDDFHTSFVHQLSPFADSLENKILGYSFLSLAVELEYVDKVNTLISDSQYIF